MRPLALALALLVAAPLAAAAEEYVVHHDWTSGTSLAGTTTLVGSPAPHVLAFEADACHRRLLLDLLYDPTELAVGAPDVGEAALAFRFAVETWQDGAPVGERVTISSSGYHRPIALLPAEGPTEVRFWLTEGAAVDWQARLRGRVVIDDPACSDPL